MSETKMCPKCSGTMELGNLGRYVRWFSGRFSWPGSWTQLGKNVSAYRCKNCGYVELYQKG